MMSVRVCFLLFVSALTMAQSNPVPRINQPQAARLPNRVSQPDSATQGKMVESYGRLPLSFEMNQGQADGRVKFLSRGSGYSLFLTNDEAVFSLRGSKAKTASDKSSHLPTRQPEDLAATSAVLRMKLVKANPAAKIAGADELPGKSNYFIGNDPKKWRSNVPTFGRVKYEGVYPGIDLVYYGNQRQLEYDFVVAPGADPHRVRFDVRGARRITQDEQGDLVLQTGVGEVRWVKPVVYQEKDGTRQEIAAHYVIDGKNRVGFAVADYDLRKPLFIDPLVYSTYLGGGGIDTGYGGIAVDSSGNAYVVGTTYGSFPTVNPLQPRSGGGSDVFIAKLNPTGTALVYSTYLGGNQNDFGFAIAVDSSGNAYITGQADGDFPAVNPLQPNSSSAQPFVAKLNPAGSALVYSTFLGGNLTGGIGYGIAADSLGNAYVTGLTFSTDFPTTPGAFQTVCGPNGDGCSFGDAFVSKINPAGSALVYSTFLGGSGPDLAQAIAVDSSGDAYVTGQTGSKDFPTMNPLQPTNPGTSVAFVTKLNPTGSGLVYSTYLGGAYLDIGYGIAIDNSGNAYVTGQTYSADFPTTPGAFQTACGNNGGVCTVGTAFVSKLDPAGSAFVYSTYLGGGVSDIGQGIAADSSGNAYVAGQTASTNFPTVTPLQPAFGGGKSDAFMSKFSPTGALVYSTYLGGSGSDVGYGIAVDDSGDPHVTGQTNSTDFPTTPGAFQTVCAGAVGQCKNGDAFVSKISTTLAAAVRLVPPNLDFGDQPVGITSTPQTTTLTNSGELTLSITSINVTGPNSGDFVETDNCGTTVASGKSCTITVTFTPKATGTRTAAVSITDNAADSPQPLPLTGVGTAPIVTLSPPSLTFGPQLIGATSAAQIVQLSASSSLSITSIVTSAEFAQSNNCGTGLAAGGSCQISVTFKPSAIGLQHGTLTITNSGAGSPQTATLSGTGTQPVLTLSPANLSFANQTVNITSPKRVSTLKNTGTGTLTITSIGITGTNSGDFAMTKSCGTSVAAGGSCDIFVTFKPSATGTRTAAVSIADSAAKSPQSLPLTGVGVLPAITLSPTSLTFPTQVVYTTSAAQVVTLKNASLGIATLKSITVTGPFGLTKSCGPYVNPGGGCTFSVTLKPKSIGALTGSLTVTDNSTNGPHTVTLTGTGTYVRLTPTSINFGNQPRGTKSLPVQITMNNQGSVAVAITSIAVTGAHPEDFVQTNTCGTSLAAGATCFINVIFAPFGTGNPTAQVVISNNGGGSPETVSLTGTGIP